MIDRNSHKAKRVLAILDPETRMRHIHELCRPKRRCETAEDGDESQMDTLMRDWVHLLFHINIFLKSCPFF